MRLEERQMERDAQMRREEREYHLQMMQMFMQFSSPQTPTTTLPTFWLWSRL